MSEVPHDHYRARVTTDPTASSPAPVDEGKKKGYFDDHATRSLLDLSPVDAVLHSGTYGDKELSVAPVKFSSVRTATYDRRLLPFTPANHAFTCTYIAMHERNGQYPVLAQTRRNLEETLNRALLDAQIAANSAGISLPNYTIALIPRVNYSEGGDDRPFPYQFKIFFAPSASRMRGARIGRIGATLDATTNAASAMGNDFKGWPKGEPIGILMDVEECSEEDVAIITAYQALGVPRVGSLPDGLELAPLAREEARDILIGKTLGKSIPITNILDVSLDLDINTGTDDDALPYVSIAPDHDEHNLNADGEAKTRGQRQEEADYALMDELQEHPEEERMEQDPVPPYEPRQSESETTFATSALQLSLSETNTGLVQSLTPASTTASMPSSEAASATSSNPDASVPRTRRSTVAARRSRNYQGPYTQPASSSFRPHRPLTRRPPSPARHYSPPPPRHRSPSRNNSPRRHSPPHRQASRRSLSPDRRPTRRQSPSPPNLTLGTIRGRNMPVVPGVRIIQTQELHRIVQDTDTGISALVPVMQVSSSQMGLDLSALMQPSDPGGRSRAPRPIEGSRSSVNEYYHPRPRSPPRERPSRRRSPSPTPRYRPPSTRRRSPSPTRHRPSTSRRSSPPPRQYDGPSRHQHETSTRCSSPPRQGFPGLHYPRPTLGNFQRADSTNQDASRNWGEAIPSATPWTPTPATNTSATSTPHVSTNLETDSSKTAGPSNTPSDMR